MKLEHGVLAEAEAPGRRPVGRRRLPVLGRRVHPRQPGPRAGGRRDRVTRSWCRGRCTARCCSGWSSPGSSRSGCARRSTRSPGCRSASAVDDVAPRPARAPRRRGRCSSATRRTSARCRDVAGLADRGARSTASRCSSTRRGRRTSASTPTCRRTRSPPGADALVTSAHKTLPAYSPGRARAGPHRAARRRPARRAPFEATADHQPGRGHPRQHRRRPCAARSATARRCSAGCVAAARARPATRLARRSTASSSSTAPASTRPSCVVLLAGTGADGNAVERDLRRRAACRWRWPTATRLVPIVTLADDREHGAAARRGAGDLDRAAPRDARDRVTASGWELEPRPVLPPREAFFARHERVAIGEAVGRTCAELVAPYPPGVPVLAPGEEITRSAVPPAAAGAGDADRLRCRPGSGTATVVAG